MATPAESYDFKPFPGSSHTWALNQVAALPGGPLSVLDVGAAGGAISQRIRVARPGSRFTAIEPGCGPPPDWPSSDPWLPSLEQLEEGEFDLALALDVLEHVQEPKVLLDGIVARCRPGAWILVSVPNVAHWSVRAQLAAGRFEYADRGILDRTHLRFFTRKSFERLLVSSGLRIESRSQSLVPLELFLPDAVRRSAPWALLSAARLAGARVWPGLLGFQLLVRARA
ncbi:MAG: class I SAM-dependent methyltransferase [Planctomycetota bacterium]